MRHNQSYSLWHSAERFWLLPWLASFWNVFNDSALDFVDQRWAEDAILSSRDVEDRN